MKAVKVVLIIAIILYGGAVYWSHKEGNRIDEIKSHSTKYSYFVHSSEALRSMASKDIDCIALIKKYYDDVVAGTEIYVPPCSIHVIPYTDKVYVLSIDTPYARIAHFYKTPNGIEEYFEGYVVLSTLQELRYIENE